MLEAPFIQPSIHPPTPSCMGCYSPGPDHSCPPFHYPDFLVMSHSLPVHCTTPPLLRPPCACGGGRTLTCSLPGSSHDQFSLVGSNGTCPLGILATSIPSHLLLLLLSSTLAAGQIQSSGKRLFFLLPPTPCQWATAGSCRPVLSCFCRLGSRCVELSLLFLPLALSALLQ